jgi:hypothetical protein
MSTVDDSSDPSSRPNLKDKLAELEIQKISDELAEARNPLQRGLKRLSILTAFLAAFGGFFGVFQLWYSGYFDVRRERLELETGQLAIEKKQMEDELRQAKEFAAAAKVIV